MNKKLILIFTAIIVVGIIGVIILILYFVPSLPTIESISPSSGTVGTEVTIKGSGFHPDNNEIHFDCGERTHCFYSKEIIDGERITSSDAVLENIPSPDRKTLTFVIPEVLKSTFGEWFLPVGEIEIRVVHSGYVSNSIKFILESKGKTKIEQAKEKLLKELMTIKGVVGGGISECKLEWKVPMLEVEPKVEVSKTITQLCVKVYLEEDSEELRKQIPLEIEGFKVDIEVTGPIEALPR